MKEIQLTQGKFALVDDADYEHLNQFRWHCIKAHKRDVYYVLRSKRINGKWSPMPMHRQIMNPNKGMVVDHINGNGLDNRRVNLRVCTPAQNCYNSGSAKGSISKYKGVSWYRNKKVWRSRITVDGITKMLGYYKSELDAAIMYNIAVRKYHKEFARPNKLEKVS